MHGKGIILLIVILVSSFPIQSAHADITKVIGVQWDFQHKDTPMLCLQGCDVSGDNAWDNVHIDHRTHGDMYCVRASIAMIANYFNNKNGPERLSQDRITYYMTEGNGLGPEYDLKHSETAGPTETLAWALGMEPENLFIYEYYWRFRDSTEFLNDNRVILGVWDGHARVIDGYKITDSGSYFHILDPWPITEPTEEEKWVSIGEVPTYAWFIVTAAVAPGVRHDEETIWEDSDSDGVCDFDEINRFFTNPYEEDSDSDSINDKEEILSYNYDYWGEFGPGYFYDYIVQKLTLDYPVTVDGVPVAIYYLRGNNPLFPYTKFDFNTGDDIGWHLNQPLIDLIEMRSDIDEDDLRVELDVDSDGDGLTDRSEDKNGNGVFEWWLGETNSLIWDTIPPTTFLSVNPDYYESESTLYVTSETLHTLYSREDVRSQRDLDDNIGDRYNEINKGVEYTRYRYYPADLEGTLPDFSPYRNPFTITGEPGEYVIEFYSMDKHGNVEELKTVHETLSNIVGLELNNVYIEGVEYYFDRFTNEFPDTYTFEWSFGSTLKSGKIPSFTFPSNGLTLVSLQALESSVLKGTQSFMAIILDTSPVADFTTTGPYSEGSPIQFNDMSTPGNDEIVSWLWDFDGEETSTQQNPAYTFKDEGTYLVSLRVTDDDGSESTIVKEITILNQAPTGILAPLVKVLEGEVVEFKLIVNDPGVFDLQTIEWDFGDGQIPKGYGEEPYDLFKPIHVYHQDGEYFVEVNIDDGDGGTDTLTVNVLVENVDPTITSLTGGIINEDEEATISGTFTDPGTDDTFTVTIDWGEGTPIDYNYPVGSTGFSESHQYNDDNPTATSSDVYTVYVTVTDDYGGSDTDSTTVTVNNVAPVITKIDVAPNPTQINQITAFTGYFTEVGTEDTHTATWDWGDGSAVENGNVHVKFSVGTVTGSHTYSDYGVYSVTLTVFDDDTGYHTQTLRIVVLPLSDITTGDLCGFDKDDDPEHSTFRLIFTPYGTNYKLSASNPGQLYYNIFIMGPPGTDIDFNIQLPIEFETQGAMPLRAYSMADVIGGCYVPIDEVLVQSELTVDTLIPETGLLYVTVHVDYKYKQETGFSPDAEKNAVNGHTILDGQEYRFYVTGLSSDHEDIVDSFNIFKNDPGFLGFVLDSSNQDPVAGEEITVTNADGSLVGTTISDENGYYFLYYKHTGKAAEYTVTHTASGQFETYMLKANKYVQTDFYIK